MRHPSNDQKRPYPADNQHQDFVGIHDPNRVFHHPHRQEEDTSYHGAASSFSYPSPYNNRGSLASINTTSTSTSTDPDDWRDWSGAHGPHNQSDVARLSGEHIVQARLSAEQERSIRSSQSARRASEESGRSAQERMMVQRLSAIGRPSGESGRSGVSVGRVRGEEEGLTVGVGAEERERSRGNSPSEVWRGMQTTRGVEGGEFD